MCSYVGHRSVPVIVGLVFEHRLFFKVMRDRRRGTLPLERGSAPWVVRRLLANFERRQQIDSRHKQPGAQHPAPVLREGMDWSKLVQEIEEPARHPLSAHNDL